MPVAPEMDDAGPTRRHSGKGVFSHIELKSPNPMMSGDRVEECDNWGVANLSACYGGRSPSERIVERVSPQQREGLVEWRGEGDHGACAIVAGTTVKRVTLKDLQTT